VIVPANEAGRGVHGGGLTPGPAGRWACSCHLGAGRDQLRDAHPRLYGRFRFRWCCCAVRCAGSHRVGRLSGGARLQHHERVLEARVPRFEGRGTRGDDRTAFESLGVDGRVRWSSTCPKDVQNSSGTFKGEGMLEVSGLREADRGLARGAGSRRKTLRQFFQMLRLPRIGP